MGQLFAKPKPKSRVTDEDKAILELKMERDKLKITIKRYEKNIEREKQIARELLHKGQKE
jgi:charged multivesicular body protein 6